MCLKNNSEGYCKGETCNRNGCDGIIAEHHSDGGCSCHINPPCSYCETAREYCPVCDWDGNEEQQESIKESTRTFVESGQAESYKKQQEEWSKKREEFFRKYRGEAEITAFDYRKESHTHFSMKVIGIHPKGFDLSSKMDEIKGSFGGRFTRRTDTTFEYIAYTD